MSRWILGILVMMATLPESPAKSVPRTENSPTVSISFPPDIATGTVQLRYFLIGSFGGKGDFEAKQVGLHSLEIPASVDGKSATEIRIIVYAPGCDIQIYALTPKKHPTILQRFNCHPVAKVRLSGQIVPVHLATDDHARVIITYNAFWDHGFFGIADGAVTQFQLASVSPDANGVFVADLPLFLADSLGPAPPAASLTLILQNAKTGNNISFGLGPELPELASPDGGLRIQSHYPHLLKFSPPTF